MASPATSPILPRHRMQWRATAAQCVDANDRGEHSDGDPLHHNVSLQHSVSTQPIAIRDEQSNGKPAKAAAQSGPAIRTVRSGFTFESESLRTVTVSEPQAQAQ